MHTLILLFAALTLTACAADLGTLGTAQEPDLETSTPADATHDDAAIAEVFDAALPESSDTLDALESKAPSFDATPSDANLDEPGMVRCPAASATGCDLRNGHTCCALSEGRRCVAPGEPVPGDVCPQPLQCDDGADCKRPGFGGMTHCCQRTGGASDCRSGCGASETELP